ncbi:hypothetical protein [Actinophytocola algeriensis]|jgi:hypothetical protein|uniref:Uncharacterized protein n=1 Tax=Actinophytocola algeriensis TaxID=1768010 RepID=A0A7W7QFJ1_9PSEU|nr:hypothetical protein [Actinophytocola algeriensis]MBB4912518.1 hypothetical protein [Actinophytocola algeriensis]MBE1478892.1 hypothetical protein [Actinophytocola algeriensis]
MSQDLNVGSWVIVRRGCPIAYCVNGEEIEFRLGSRHDGFDFVFEVAALEAFVEASQEVLAELTRA